MPQRQPVPIPRRDVVAPAKPDVIVRRNHREIRARTKRIVDLERQLGTRDAEGRVTLGRELAAVRARLEHGEWLTWIDVDSPYDPRTVQRLVRLSSWAAENPTTFQEFRHIGSSKLYFLTAQTPAIQKQIFGRKLHAVPSRTDSRPLEKLTFKEVVLLVLSLRPKLELVTPAEKARKACNRSLRALDKALDQLVKHAQQIDVDAALIWRASLIQAATRIAIAFALPPPDPE